MSWDDLTDSVRRRVQSGRPPEHDGSIIWAIARLSALAGLIVAAVFVPAAAFTAVTANNVSKAVVDLPLSLKDIPAAQTTRLLASDGSLLALFYEENRQDIPLGKISGDMKDALLAIEDSRFYSHGALDLKGTLRALVNNASDRQTQGGSSITQQLVKLTLVQQATTKEQVRAATKESIARKIRELKLAIAYEEDHTKEEILERYFNIAYFGDGAYGIQSAANHFFSVSPDKLDVLQSATLAGLVKNPVEFDPRVYPERALQRRNLVLGAMAANGKISQKEADDLSAEPLNLKITSFPNGCVTSKAAFSCDYIRRYLLAEPALGASVQERRTRLERGGLTIKSSIDVRMQKAINKAVNSTVGAKDRAIGSRTRRAGHRQGAWRVAVPSDGSRQEGRMEESPSTTIDYGGGLEAGTARAARGRRQRRGADRRRAARLLSDQPAESVGQESVDQPVHARQLAPARPGRRLDRPDADVGGYGFNEYRVVGTYREPRLFDRPAMLLLTAFFEQGDSFELQLQPPRRARGVCAPLGPVVTVSGRYAYRLARGCSTNRSSPRISC